MSFRVSSICAARILKGSSRKQVMLYLADKASDDGSGVWCSKATIACETELSRSTVKRIMNEFEAERLITRTGRRKNKNGYTVEYSINLQLILQLAEIELHYRSTRCNINQVQSEPPRETIVNRQDGSACTPNLKQTIQQPPTREREMAEGATAKLFELAWSNYPNDRRRNRSTCEMHFRAAIENGAKPETIVRAIQNYAETSRGYTRSKVKFSDNWFSNIDWRQFIETEAIETTDLDEAFRKSLDLCVDLINNESPQCTYITANQLAVLMESGRVTKQQLVKLGLDQKLPENNHGQI